MDIPIAVLKYLIHLNMSRIVLTGCCQSTQRMAIPIAVFTELILLKMSSKPS
jgi:hypothetical protein